LFARVNYYVKVIILGGNLKPVSISSYRGDFQIRFLISQFITKRMPLKRFLVKFILMTGFDEP
jgi:hypothetical protein